jgi:hypothetical protein
MEARFATHRSSSDQPRARRWRTILAVVISLALVLSYFHGWQFDSQSDSDDGQVTVSISQTCDTSGKTPTGPAPMHGDHCLAHMANVAPHVIATAVDYVNGGYRFASMAAPDPADRGSPFKPPRV